MAKRRWTAEQRRKFRATMTLKRTDVKAARTLDSGRGKGVKSGHKSAKTLARTEIDQLARKQAKTDIVELQAQIDKLKIFLGTDGNGN